MQDLLDTVADRPLVVIPARNEQATIADVIAEVRSAGYHDVVVADDASTDATRSEAIAAGARVIPLVYRLGAWGATQAGLRYALRKGYSVAITMDADGQHLAEAIPLLLEALRRHDADVAIGACLSRGSRARRAAWIFFRKLTGLSVEDLTSGFRAYGCRAVRLLSSNQATLLDFQDIGILTLLRANRLRIREVSVDMRPRRSGHSRIFHTWLSVAYYMTYSILLCVSKWNRRERTERRPSAPA